MRFGAVVVAVAVLQVVAAYQLEMPDYWAKLGAVKIMEGCLGRNFTGIWVRTVMEALGDCSNTSHADAGETIASLEATNWNEIFDEYSPRFDGQSGLMPISAQRVAGVKTKLGLLIKKFRCTMQRVGMTDSNNEVDLENLLKLYNDLQLPQPLLGDLLAGATRCYELTLCLPSDHFYSSPIPDDVIRTMTFVNCERYMRNWGCLKDYLKSYLAAGEFDFSGADGTLDFLPDDEARAAAIALANQLVGGDDFGLYE